MRLQSYYYTAFSVRFVLELRKKYFMAERVEPAVLPRDLIRYRADLAEKIIDNIAGGGNPIRAHVNAWTAYEDLCRVEAVPINGAALHLGNIDAAGFSKEQGFEDLALELGIDPSGKVYERIEADKRELDKSYFDRRQPLTQYGSFNGIAEVRQAFADYLDDWGGITISPEGTFFSSGGASEEARRLITALGLYNQDKNQPANFLTTVPNYGPIINMARDNSQMEVITCQTTAEDNYFISPETAKILVKENNIGIFYLVPIGNPSSAIISPEQIEAVTKAVLEANPNITFLVDLAYLTTIDTDQAKAILAGFVKAGVLNNCLFLTSLSKSHGRPGDRLGAGHTLNQELLSFIRMATEQANPSESRSAMLEAVAVLKQVKPETIKKLAQLYGERRQALIEVLGQINQNAGKEVFANLDNLRADGALYVYPELGAEIGNALNLFIQLGIMGIGGRFFGEGEESNRVRLAIGTITTEEIKNIPDLILK